MTFKSLTIAAAALTLTSVPAAATAEVSTTMNGTLGAALSVESSSTPSIGVNSLLLLSGGVVTSKTGDFNPVTNFASLSTMSFTATNGSSFSFTSNFGDFTGSVSNVDAQGPVTNRSLTAFALGTFTPAGIFAGYIAGPASLTFSFTQNGAEGAIQGGFTMSTPPVSGVIPEPASWAMLIAGFGLTGAAMRRRRAAVAA